MFWVFRYVLQKEKRIEHMNRLTTTTNKTVQIQLESIDFQI